MNCLCGEQAAYYQAEGPHIVGLTKSSTGSWLGFPDALGCGCEYL